MISAVATSLLAQGQPPLGERVLVAAVGPLITVLVGGLVVWAVTSKVQHNREQAEIKLQHEREDAIRTRDEQRADEAVARESRARDDALRHELVTKMTEAAGTLYLTGQNYWRLKRDAKDNPNDATLKAFRDFRGELDAAYLESRKVGEVVEKRLEGYFVSSEPRDSWHSTMDTLTVRYFQLTDQDTDRLYDENEGPQHTGLSKIEMRDPKVLLNRYRNALAAAVQSVFETPLRARSGAPEGEPSRVDVKAQTNVELKSSGLPAMPPDPTHKWKGARKWSLIGLGGIAAAALIGLIFAWRGYGTSNTLRYELAKTFMQVLAVAVLGGLAAIATFNYQNSRAQEDVDTRRAEDEKKEEIRREEDKKEKQIRQDIDKKEQEIRRAEDEKERKRERNRRELEIARAERRRQDDQLRSIMEETLRIYNRVKRIRRFLEAETNDGASGSLKLGLYDRYMAELIDEQLAFERLKRFTPFISDKRLNPFLDATQPQTAIKSQTLTKSSLKQSYESIETYLNDVIEEYQKKRHTVPQKAGVPLAEFPELRGFIDDKFKARVPVQMDKIIDALLEALWQPIDSPPP